MSFISKKGKKCDVLIGTPFRLQAKEWKCWAGCSALRDGLSCHYKWAVPSQWPVGQAERDIARNMLEDWGWERAVAGARSRGFCKTANGRQASESCRVSSPSWWWSPTPQAGQGTRVSWRPSWAKILPSLMLSFFYDTLLGNQTWRQCVN